MGVDPDRPYRLHPSVALRPEPFGALAYHYGNRRLTFMKSPHLVALVRELERHESLADALTACNVADGRRRAYVHALDTLEASEVIAVR